MAYILGRKIIENRLNWWRLNLLKLGKILPKHGKNILKKISKLDGPKILSKFAWNNQ
jgi:hypothetical protein